MKLMSRPLWKVAKNKLILLIGVSRNVIWKNKFLSFINISYTLGYFICVSCCFVKRLIYLKILTEYVIVFTPMFLLNKIKLVAKSCDYKWWVATLKSLETTALRHLHSVPVISCINL